MRVRRYPWSAWTRASVGLFPRLLVMLVFRCICTCEPLLWRMGTRRLCRRDGRGCPPRVNVTSAPKLGTRWMGVRGGPETFCGI